MGINVRKKDVVWSYIGTAFSLGSNFILLPFMMRFLNSDQIGIYSIFISISAIAQLFSFGFGPCFARNIAYCWSGAKELKKQGVISTDGQEPNYALMKKTLVSCKFIYGILSLFALFFIGTLGTIYIYHVTKSVSGNNHIISWWIFVFALFLNLFFGYYNSFLSGVGDVADLNKATIASKIIQIVITIALLILKLQLVAYAVGFLICGLSFRFIGKIYFDRFNNIKYRINEIKTKLSKNDVLEMLSIIWPNAWRDGIVSLANYLLNQASTIIVSLFLPLSETGVYSLSVQLVTAVATISSTLYNTYMPALQSAAVYEDKDKMKRYMSVIVIVYSIVFVLGMIGVIFVIIPLLGFVKPDYVFSIPVILVAGLYQFILKLRNCYATYFSSTNRVIYAKAFLLSAFICIALSYYALGILSFGVMGILVAQIISQAIYNMWYWPIKAHKELNLSIREMVTYSIDELRTLLKIGNTY